MVEKMVCNRCGRTYADKGSIEISKKMQKDWEKRCHEDGCEPKGIAPCPICCGELILVSST